MAKRSEKQHLFDKPENVRRLLFVLYGICAVLFVADFLLHRHAEHPLQALPGFYSVYGFLASVVLVLIAGQVRKGLMRREDYYDDPS